MSVNPATGYGHFTCTVNGSKSLHTAHRTSYSAFVGEIPQNMLVLHRCDNRLCFNPAHLFLGTQLDNMRDMVGKGRQRFFGRPAKARVLDGNLPL